MTEVPWKALSMSTSGRGMEWQAPLWEAIGRWSLAIDRDDQSAVEKAVRDVNTAVELAMSIAIEEVGRDKEKLRKALEKAVDGLSTQRWPGVSVEFLSYLRSTLKETK